jgi:hypothetical protein
MDPITVTHLVQDRTQDLQRIADQVRQERSLRATRTAAAAETTPPASARPAEPRRVPAPNPARAAGCAPAEPAV